jgi:hypothetical protein
MYLDSGKEKIWRDWQASQYAMPSPLLARESPKTAEIEPMIGAKEDDAFAVVR